MSLPGRACAAVSRLAGVDLAPYKDSVLLRRLRARARAAGTPDLGEYVVRLEAGDAEAHREARRLVAGINVGVSSFFRDPAVFAFLERDVFPLLAGSAPSGEPARVWSAGCSTGQEAYSLAISLRAFYLGRREARAVSVLATDVDERSLAVAREAVYPVRLLRGLPPDVLEQSFESLAGGARRVAEDIRGLVRFERSNLLDIGGHPAGVDLIACRNLLIYLRRDVQEDLLVAFGTALRPGGFLVLGQGETLLGRPWRLFDHVSPSHRVYRRPPG